MSKQLLNSNLVTYDQVCMQLHDLLLEGSWDVCFVHNV